MAALADGEAQLAQETSRWRTLDAFFARIEGDLRAALPRSVRHGACPSRRSSASVDADGNAALTLTRAGSEFDGGPGAAGQRIGYRVEHGTVEIAYWPALDNVATAQPRRISAVERRRASCASATARTTGAGSRNGRCSARPMFLPRSRVDLLLDDGVRVERWIALQ